MTAPILKVREDEDGEAASNVSVATTSPAISMVLVCPDIFEADIFFGFFDFFVFSDFCSDFFFFFFFFFFW